MFYYLTYHIMITINLKNVDEVVKAESYEDSPDIPRTLNDILTQWTTIKLYKIQTLLEDIQLAVNLNKASYEESLLLNGFVKCQQ